MLTGSAGKTFSGPQSGVMVWNDPELTPPLLDAVFPALAATHQVNRVAALAAAAAELLAFGPEYMAGGRRQRPDARRTRCRPAACPSSARTRATRARTR